MTRLASDVEAQVKQKLFEANYADSTLKKYRASVARFMSWVDDNKVPYSELDTAAGVDDLACRYISWLFAQSDGDSGKSVASTLLSALVAASPHLEGKLVLAAKMSRGWLRLQPAVAYPPLSWELTLVIAYQMKRAGKPLFALSPLSCYNSRSLSSTPSSARSSVLSSSTCSQLFHRYRRSTSEVWKPTACVGLSCKLLWLGFQDANGSVR